MVERQRRNQAPPGVALGRRAAQARAVAEGLGTLLDPERLAERRDLGTVPDVEQYVGPQGLVAHHPARQDPQAVHLGEHAVQLGLRWLRPLGQPVLVFVSQPVRDHHGRARRHQDHRRVIFGPPEELGERRVFRDFGLRISSGFWLLLSGRRPLAPATEDSLEKVHGFCPPKRSQETTRPAPSRSGDTDSICIVRKNFDQRDRTRRTGRSRTEIDPGACRLQTVHRPPPSLNGRARGPTVGR